MSNNHTRLTISENHKLNPTTMKIMFNAKMIVLSFIIMTGLVSCQGLTGESDDLFEEPDFEDFGMYHEVATFSPTVSNNSAIFKGEVTFTQDAEKVQYGFMWFALNDDRYSVPTRIELGTTVADKSFSVVMTDLPVDTELIVCAFVRPESWQDDLIGDEEDFTVPK